MAAPNINLMEMNEYVLRSIFQWVEPVGLGSLAALSEMFSHLILLEVISAIATMRGLY